MLARSAILLGLKAKGWKNPSFARGKRNLGNKGFIPRPLNSDVESLISTAWGKLALGAQSSFVANLQLNSLGHGGVGHSTQKE